MTTCLEKNFFKRNKAIKAISLEAIGAGLRPGMLFLASTILTCIYPPYKFGESSILMVVVGFFNRRVFFL